MGFWKGQNENENKGMLPGEIHSYAHTNKACLVPTGGNQLHL